MFYSEYLRIDTEKKLQISDITDQVKTVVAQSKVTHGMVTIQSLHTTAAVVINEKESLLHEDFRRHLECIAPEDDEYRHDDFSVRTENMCDGECANGHAHCKAIHLPTSVTLNIEKGMIVFGLWQRILFIELDRARPRKIHIAVMGE